MEAVKTLLRLFAFLFHGLLALFLIAVAGFALTSGVPSLQMGMLPWTGSTLEYVVLGASLAGLITVILAIRRKLRLLFLMWSLAVAALLVRGYIFSGYHFAPGGVGRAIGLTVASLVAILGAWFQLFVPGRRSPRY